MSSWKIIKNKPELYESKMKLKESFLCVFENFLLHRSKYKLGQSLDSSELISGEKSEYKWIVRIYPNGYSLHMNCVVIKLSCLNEEFKNRMHNVTYNISILNKMNMKVRQFSIESFNRDTYRHDLESMKISKQAIQPLLINENLKVLIEIKTIINHLPTAVYPESNDLLKFLENEKFTDVILEFNGTELKTHKILLSLKSSVFCAMFENETMKETQENRVVIDDIDAEVGRQMLEFIYTDREPSKLNELTTELLIVSDKYGIDELKKMCEKKLIKNINRDNSVSVLIFSNMYNGELLKKCAIDFIGVNAELLKSVEFKNLERNDTELAMEVYRHLLTKNLKI